MAKGLEVAAFTVAKEQALDVLFLLAKDTPVDQAKARSNWRIGISRPLRSIISPYRPYQSRHKPPYTGGGSKSERANLNAVMDAGRAKLARYTKGSLYIGNNLPYIGPLDRGHSSQTTAGFVARSVSGAVIRTEPKIKKIFDKEFSK